MGQGSHNFSSLNNEMSIVGHLLVREPVYGSLGFAPGVRDDKSLTRERNNVAPCVFSLLVFPDPFSNLKTVHNPGNEDSVN